MQLLLASNSPRRRDLLAAVGLDSLPRASDAPEHWPAGAAGEAAVAVAEQKLQAAFALWPADASSAECVWLAADTAVVLAGEALGKPKDVADAVAILSRLSGREHTVVTGFVVGHKGEVAVRQAVTTAVQMRAFGSGEIERYVATGECMDKAGAYAVQGRGQALVARVSGSLSNVVGLPLEEVLAVLAAFGIAPPAGLPGA